MAKAERKSQGKVQRKPVGRLRVASRQGGKALVPRVAKSGAKRGSSGGGVATSGTKSAPGGAGLAPGALAPRQVQAYREVFWQNVLREVLISLVSMSAASDASHGLGADRGEGGVPHSEASSGLDGRLGLITTQGQRIPIGRVFPVFAASMARSPREVTLASLLQCTVFQVHTPRGEVYTLPLQEVRGFHALTEELMEELAAAARGEASGPESGSGASEPFGFAAFTSMARGKLPPDVPDGGSGLGDGGEGWSDASAI